MKVLQLNVTANWGSTGKIAEGIGEAAMARGWESWIAFGRYSNISKSSLIKVGGQKDVYLHYAKNRFFDGEGLGSKKATKELINKINEIKPDIIHLHNIHDHWLNYPILFEYFTTIDTPIVWTFHDCWAFTGHCYHFENVRCNKWEKECRQCPLRFKFSFDKSNRNFNLKKSLLESILPRLTIVCVSNWIAEKVKKSFFSGAKIIVLYNGINIDFFKPLNIPKKKTILGVSNVWPESKGLNEFKELRELLSNDIEIKLVGLNKRQINSLPKGIEGFQRITNIDELIKLYNEAFVFVNPTKNDTFPTVNIEALACGTPVITYNTGGSPEAVDNNTGFVVEKGDIEGLAGAINHIIDNPNQFISDDCRKRAVEYFNKNIQFEKYVDLYQSLICLKPEISH